jgi:SAM-dependent methyltransferase
MAARQATATGPIVAGDTDLRDPVLAHNELSLTGWAEGQAEVESVIVRIGGGEHAAACDPSAGGTATGPPGETRRRYELTLDVSGWPRGEHPFEVVATDADGAATTVAGVADVQPYDPPPGDEAGLIESATGGGSAMWCEQPDLASGGDVRGDLEISGWAIGAGGIDQVLVTIDGRLRLRALHGLMRPDLRWCFGDELASGCGFTLRLDPSEAPPGRHDVTVVAVAADGSAVGVSGSVHCHPGEPHEASPDGEIDLLPPERFAPDAHHGLLLEPEHHVRYRWATRLIADMTVLDAGCGTGWGTAVLSARARATVGVDISPVAVAEATDRHGDRARFVEGDICRLPFDDGEFDAVVCFEAIEQLADVGTALDELRRVLRPGGMLLASAANRGVYPAGNPLHVSEPTSAELHALVDARFAEVTMHRQQTYVASLLGDDAALEAGDPGREIAAEVSKAVGGPPGSELYAVVVASDDELPPLGSAQVVLGTMVDVDEQRRLTASWRERCVHAEIDAAATRTEIHYARTVQRETLERERGRAEAAAERLAALEGSLSWRVTQPLRAAKRLARRARRR